MPTAVVTGANSGIGYAFAKLLCDEDYKVHAIDRENGKVLQSLKNATTHTVDVTSPDSINSFKSTLGSQPIDLLLNIAGISALPKDDSLETCSMGTLEKTFAVNTFGPLLLIQALLPNILEASPGAKIGIVSSRVGSMGDNTSGGTYAYRASKAAVNSIGRSMAMDLKDKGVTVMLLHPGIVWSNLLPDPQDASQAVQPEEAVTKLWKNIVTKKGLEDTGKFWHREGQELPW